MRGGDFLFESGQDLSIGYDSHDSETVQLYLEESFSFRVATAEARSRWYARRELKQAIRRRRTPRVGLGVAGSYTPISPAPGILN